MARPRKYNVDIPGLSCFTDARTKKVYWRYKHPVTGKFHGLGTDEKSAREIAIEANSRLAERQMKQLIKARDEISRHSGKSITVQTWIGRYMKIQEERLQCGEIKMNTYRQKGAPLKSFLEHYGMKPVDEVNVRDIADLLDEYRQREQHRMAQIVRMVLIDVYKEAQHAGEVPPGYNPAQATKQPRNKVQRERLNIEEWKVIFETANGMPRYIQNTMLIALVTGQRLGDIARMKFSDIWDGYLHIEQSKTGTKLAIPLSLKCEAIDTTLEQVIVRCRDKILSPHIIHHHHTTSQAKRGGAVSEKTITSGFSNARDKSGLQWKNGTPPTFHEQRSLAERLYRDQGINTQHLLGHKNQAQTDKYHDDRGKNWLVVAV
ncbi:phage integrase Arm DNA-binding domain-containing protein [Mangrovibacter plantisponsor]|uniref:Phage integrase family protein n=1 Tax=Mangrovibacter plantisponsor TaxID=451513 RepID=A0A317Q713_9ENTR|nr:phage integrase Arm DNA-binding domain-containing protein [Mangrovibacter plantisponsor]PWW09910.1 phage integrase family protein [Mangrovibacter plantisponsor]